MLTPKAKKLGFMVAIIAIFIAGYFLADKVSFLKKLKPSISANMPDDVKKAVKSGTPHIKVGVITWGGYAGGEYYNGGFKANTAGRYFKEQGILVDFIILDDFKVSREALKSGNIDVLWGTTGEFPIDVTMLKGDELQSFFVADWSRGGDAIVAKTGINTIQDLRGKRVAAATGSCGHGLLLIALASANMSVNDITLIGVGSPVDAAQQFKAGAVDAAAMWSPDDEDCVRTVPGSKVIMNTKKATNQISDHFFTKKKYLEKNKAILEKLVAGWVTGAAEINTSPSAKSEAIRILAEGLKVDTELAKKSLENARLCTLGDNKVFFGLQPGYKGEELYNKMTAVWKQTGVVKDDVPPWRSVSDSSIVSAVKLSTPGQEAEGQVKFAAPVAADSSVSAFSSKNASVTFPSGSAILTEDAKVTIATQFANTAKEFGHTRIRIEGNTDNVGNSFNNVTLSKRRAQAVADYLASTYNFDRNRFVVVGNGSNRPLCNEATSECYATNRRTDFSLLEK